MTPPAAVAAEKVIEPFPMPAPTGDAQADAIHAFAQATNRLAAAIEGFQGAADTVHGFGARLDAFCTWVKGKWPWVAIGGYLLLSKVIESPADLIAALNGLKSLGAP